MHTKKLIYYAHIYSHLVYSCTTWGNMLRKEQIKKLQRLQNKCIKLITGKSATKEVYQSVKELQIAEIIKLQNYKLGYKVQHSQLPAKIINACTTDANKDSLTKTHQYNTRRKSEQNCPWPRSKWYQESFMAKCVQAYQSLPDHIHNIQHFPSFVSKAKHMLLTA